MGSCVIVDLGPFLINNSLKILLWKLKSWLTTCIYVDNKYKRSVKSSTFIATIYIKGLLISKGLVTSLVCLFLTRIIAENLHEDWIIWLYIRNNCAIYVSSIYIVERFRRRYSPQVNKNEDKGQSLNFYGGRGYFLPETVCALLDTIILFFPWIFFSSNLTNIYRWQLRGQIIIFLCVCANFRTISFSIKFGDIFFFK